jgi:hypothetical protein
LVSVIREEHRLRMFENGVLRIYIWIEEKLSDGRLEKTAE